MSSHMPSLRYSRTAFVYAAIALVFLLLCGGVISTMRLTLSIKYDRIQTGMTREDVIELVDGTPNGFPQGSPDMGPGILWLEKDGVIWVKLDEHGQVKSKGIHYFSERDPRLWLFER